MPSDLVHAGVSATCPHAGRVLMLSGANRVLVNGMPVASAGDRFPIVGCSFTTGGSPQPCVNVHWVAPASRILINGQPAILQSSTGLCLNAEHVSQGPALVAATQRRVSGL